MKQSIYNIEQEYLQLAEEIIENGGEVTPEQEQALALNKDTLEVKSVKYGYVIKDVENDLVAIDAEIKRLEALKSSRVNLIAKLKDTVSQAMDLYGIEEIKMQNLKINFRSSQSTEITDETLIPAKYKKSVTTVTISKNDLLADLKLGVKIEGAELKKNKNIQFK